MSIYMIYLLSVLIFRLLNIEYEMTQFAFYYVGIGAAVFLLGYFQVSFDKPDQSDSVWFNPFMKP